MTNEKPLAVMLDSQGMKDNIECDLCGEIVFAFGEEEMVFITSDYKTYHNDCFQQVAEKYEILVPTIETEG